MRFPNRDAVSERGSDRSAGLSRRRLLGASAAATTAGLGGCVELPRADVDSVAPVTTTCTDVDPADSVSEYATHPDDDVSLFRRGLRRLGYYPDEVVPASVRVDWSFPINRVGHTAAKASPVPTPDGETIVFAGDDGRVYARAPTGEQRWSVQTDATGLGFHGSAAIVDGTAYIGGYDGDLYALDIETGNMVWRTRSADLEGTLAIGSSPAYYDETLYVIAEYGSPSSGALWAIDPETGEPIWSDDRVWGQAHPSPTIDLEAGRILAGSNDGVVYCWTFPSLEFAWSFQADADGEEQEGGQFRAGAEIKGTVAAHDGYGYVGSWDDNFYCLDLEDGSLEWAFETDGSIMSNPAVDVDADVVYMGSDDGYVYAIDAKPGEKRWSADVNGRVIGALTVTAGTVLVGSYDSYLYALDKETGDRCWRVENRGRVTSAPVPIDGRIYYAERGVFSNYYDDDRETRLEEPGHAYCLVERE
ncbi:outer membrane protein assembly factor BamB family protein [Natronorubrum thiooxidans]|uniref:Outer membrane protein assembly factor BamB, contains PQQ-like beta-propeller repeat n=1 Tax=Natronorubrum thiooxidans TaxID=308853 RepID=A0A1N7CAE8_9EURY|nr:PQQ-binding-like beta-propeller repeat protein [Natronorubrum thiooxidans]SIR60588.1 Outer membrane protein assembly factor BamB, contains PQQ-like beta-propeller repeat [Natronorubrum thiooxidans]